MKSPLVFRRRAAVLAALVLAPLSLPADLHAQDAPPAVGAAEVPTQEFRMNMEFDGMRIEEIAAYLTGKSPTPVSFIFEGKSGSVVLPRMKLKSVTVKEFVTVVNQMTMLSGDSGSLPFKIHPVTDVEGVYVIEDISRARAAKGVDPFQGSPTSPGPSTPSVFLDLADVLTEKLTINDVTTAIQTAWGTGNSEADAESLKFHEETKLLVVNAPDDRLATAQSLVLLLQNRAKAERENSSYREIEGLYRKVDQAEQERTRIAAELDQERAIGKKNQAEAQARITELEIEVAKLSEALKSAK